VDALADGDLVARYVEGDRCAADELYRRHASAVRSAVERRCGAELAEDAVQEVFARLWERPERFDPARGSLRTFLVHDGVGRAIDRWRSEAASQARSTRGFNPPATASPDQVAVARASARALRQAIAHLAEGQREAICLAFYGGVSYQEVARRLGITEGTAKWRIRSGLRALRGSLVDSGWVLAGAE
jgi:RNA polymerase sigma-70 factor (ECF subfamily)